jgi:hypothetical protein
MAQYTGSLLGWYDATNNLTLTPNNPTNGISITNWQVSSGSMASLSPVGGESAKPTYTASVQNGQGAVYFTGSVVGTGNPPDTYMDAAFTAWNGRNEASVVFVGRTLTTSSYQQAFGTDGTGLSLFVSSSRWCVSIAGGILTSSLIPSPEQSHIFTLIYSGSGPQPTR